MKLSSTTTQEIPRLYLSEFHRKYLGIEGYKNGLSNSKTVNNNYLR